MIEINKLFKNKNNNINIIFKEIDEELRARRLNNLILLTILRVSSLTSKLLL